MFTYYIDFWKHYVDFNGRSTRSQWWYVWLINSVIMSLVMIIPLAFIVITGSTKNASLFWVIAAVLAGLYSVAEFLPGLGLAIRRLRDAGFHWAFVFFAFIPYMGPVILFIFFCLPTKELRMPASEINNEESNTSKGEKK